jgi:hypothetical protein
MKMKTTKYTKDTNSERGCGRRPSRSRLKLPDVLRLMLRIQPRSGGNSEYAVVPVFISFRVFRVFRGLTE